MVRFEEVPGEVDLERHATGDRAGHYGPRGPPVHVLGHHNLPPTREAAADCIYIYIYQYRLRRVWRDGGRKGRGRRCKEEQ